MQVGKGIWSECLKYVAITEHLFLAINFIFFPSLPHILAVTKYGKNQCFRVKWIIFDVHIHIPRHQVVGSPQKRPWTFLLVTSK